VNPWVGGVNPWAGGMNPWVGGVIPWVGGMNPWAGGVIPWVGGVVRRASGADGRIACAGEPETFDAAGDCQQADKSSRNNPVHFIRIVRADGRRFQ